MKKHLTTEELHQFISDQMPEGFFDENDAFEFQMHLEETFQESTAELKEIEIASIKLPSSDNHLPNEEKQEKMDRANVNELPPILIHDDMELIDGNHRFRAHVKQGKKTILAYVIK